MCVCVCVCVCVWLSLVCDDPAKQLTCCSSAHWKPPVCKSWRFILHLIILRDINTSANFPSRVLIFIPGVYPGLILCLPVPQVHRLPVCLLSSVSLDLCSQAAVLQLPGPGSATVTTVCPASPRLHYKPPLNFYNASTSELDSWVQDYSHIRRWSWIADLFGVQVAQVADDTSKLNIVLFPYDRWCVFYISLPFFYDEKYKTITKTRK